MQQHANTHVGSVSLTVRNLDLTRDFYRRVIGLKELEVNSGRATFGIAKSSPLIELVHEPDAIERPRNTTGLFHTALLVPTREALGESLLRITNAGWQLSGAADHLVSEAIYLVDPEGNGIEIYHDRAPDQWPRLGGKLQMDTLPLDLQQLANITNHGQELPPHLPAGTSNGHVHLQVADLLESNRFYSGVLGLDVTVASYPGALFLSSGGYHHHIGLNTWSSLAANAPPHNSTGLRYYDLVLPTTAAIESVNTRAMKASFPSRAVNDEIELTDPSGIRVHLKTR